MRRRRNVLWPVAIASLAVAGGFYVYKKYMAAEPASTGDQKVRQRSPAELNSKISLVVSKSLIEHGLPLEPILTKYPNVTILVCPDVSESPAATLQLNAQVPSELAYKVISCETDIGITHVLKHLRAQRVVLAADAPVTVGDIKKFVGSVATLDSDIAVASEQIHDMFF